MCEDMGADEKSVDDLRQAIMALPCVSGSNYWLVQTTDSWSLDMAFGKVCASLVVETMRNHSVPGLLHHVLAAMAHQGNSPEGACEGFHHEIARRLLA